MIINRRTVKLRLVGSRSGRDGVAVTGKAATEGLGFDISDETSREFIAKQVTALGDWTRQLQAGEQR